MRYLVALSALVLLSGCVVADPYAGPPPHARVRHYHPAPAVVYEPVYVQPRRVPYHCPPGHARKGWC